MKSQTFKKLKYISFVVMLIIVLYSLQAGTGLIAFFALGLYLVIFSLLQIRVKGLLADERQVQISEKAAELSFKVLMPILLLTSVALTAGAGQEQFYYLKGLGVILSYITCLGILIYLFAYWYFDKKSR